MGGRRVNLGGFDSPEPTQAIAAAVNPAAPAPAAPDALFADEPDEDATVLIEKQLERVCERLLAAQRPLAFTMAAERFDALDPPARGERIVAALRCAWA